jgi:hypothetical protein
MDLRKGIATAVLATLIVTPAAMAHDPKDYDREMAR